MNSTSLAALIIEQVVFHEIPKKIRGVVQDIGLSDECTPLAPRTRDHLQRRMVAALGSTKAFDILFRPDTQSPVPELVRDFTRNPHGSDFVEVSKTVALYLYDMQAMVSPEGIVAVIHCKVQGCHALAILKIEREDGGRLTPELHDGKRTFAYEVLDDLILTEGTKFFKNALFIRRGPDDAPDPFEAGACDNQRSNTYGMQVATYFLENFLGCQLTEEPRVVTKRFFEATQDFINAQITDPIIRDDVYEHLRSQLKAETPTVSPYQFAREFVPLDYRQEYVQFLESRQIPNAAIQKDTSEIANQLRRKPCRSVSTKQVTHLPFHFDPAIK